MAVINNMIMELNIIFVLVVLSVMNLVSKEYHYVLEDTRDCFKLLKELIR